MRLNANLTPRGRSALTAAVLAALAVCGRGALADERGHWIYDTWGQNPVLDQSGYGNHLDLGASPHDPAYSTDDPFSSSGHSLDFDDDHPNGDGAGRLNTTSLCPADEFTLATWVKLDSLTCGTPTGSETPQDVLISNVGAYDASGGYQLLFNRSGGQTYLVVMYRDAGYDDRSISVNVSNWATDTWFHVAGTYDKVSGGNSELKLYVDGKLRLENDNVTGQIVYNNTPYFFLGTNYDGDGVTGACERELNGHMDETYVYSTERTDGQIRDLATITQTWVGGDGYGNDPAKWVIAKIPSYSSICVLPDYGAGNAYTVTVDGLGGAGEILGMTVNNHATVNFDAYSLTVAQGGDINAGGKMIVKNATYTPGGSLALHGTMELDNGTVAGSVNTYDGCLIVGDGTINNSLSDNRGTIRAEGGQLSIELTSDDHDYGTLGAATGGTLYVRNAPGDNELWNKDQIALTGGTLKGSSNSMMLKNYAPGDVISGYGRIQSFNVYVGEGALTASGGQLQIDLFLYTQDYYSTVNVQSGASLHVPTYPWENNNSLNLNGGSITGAMLTQDGTLSVTGTGTIQNVTFNYARTHRVENNATLKISGGGYLNNATISLGGAAGYLRVEGSEAAVHGRGVINPDVTVAQGSLYADYGGDTLRLARTLTVNGSQSAYATGGSALQVDGATVNSGNLYATGAGSTVTCLGVVTNGGTVYATSGGTVNLNGEVRNNNLVHANGGTVNVSGTIKDGSAGEFRAGSATLNVSGAIESGCDNTFSAYTGGTVKFHSSLDTSVFSHAGALDVLGGTVTLNSAGQRLTVAPGHLVAGYGYLLESGRDLANRGTVDAAGGTLEVRGTVEADPANTGDFSATLGTLYVAATLESGLYNTFTANANGTVLFPGSLSTGDFAGDALRPRGGIITLETYGATLTNPAGKAIEGYGTLLTTSQHHVLDNQGTIEADGGALVISAYGGITNDNSMSAANGCRFDLIGPLTNDGVIFTSGTGYFRLRSDTSPDGAGTFTVNTGGALYVANGFTNADLSTPDALRLAGGKIAIDSQDKLPTMTNASGKTIRGYGMLLETGQVLDNQGLLEATGSLLIGGNVNNSGHSIRADATGEDITIGGDLTNTGLVDLSGGASLTAGLLGGTGRCLLADATLTVTRDLLLDGPAFIDDSGLAATINVHGHLSNRSAAAPDFAVEHSTWNVFAPMSLIGFPHDITWPAEDRGAETDGLDENFAIGKLVLGDGTGTPGSDTFELSDEATVYCYGLHIQQDAFLDLGGRTIYYLRDGVEYNGILGTGFLLEGAYDNGEIIEIVPEPATLALLALGGLAMIRRRR